MMRLTLTLLAGVLVAPAVQAANFISKAEVDIHDGDQVFRGAQIYMESCAGCHSADLMRYSRIAQDYRLTDEQLEILMRPDQDPGDTITTNMTAEYGEAVFGVAPPDLTLLPRVKGADWIYSYLTTFYEDPDARWGVNNAVYSDIGMPHVMVHQQGLLQPEYEYVERDGDTERRLVGLNPPEQPGTRSLEEFEQDMHDLTTFMVYAAEPAALLRAHYGPYVLAFLFIFTLVMYLLKREIWRDVHDKYHK